MEYSLLGKLDDIAEHRNALRIQYIYLHGSHKSRGPYKSHH